MHCWHTIVSEQCYCSFYVIFHIHANHLSDRSDTLDKHTPDNVHALVQIQYLVLTTKTKSSQRTHRIDYCENISAHAMAHYILSEAWVGCIFDVCIKFRLYRVCMLFNMADTKWYDSLLAIHYRNCMKLFHVQQQGRRRRLICIQGV